MGCGFLLLCLPYVVQYPLKREPGNVSSEEIVALEYVFSAHESRTALMHSGSSALNQWMEELPEHCMHVHWDVSWLTRDRSDHEVNNNQYVYIGELFPAKTQRNCHKLTNRISPSEWNYAKRIYAYEQTSS